jgi:hypothetical protein
VSEARPQSERTQRNGLGRRERERRVSGFQHRYIDAKDTQYKYFRMTSPRLLSFRKARRALHSPNVRAPHCGVCTLCETTTSVRFCESKQAKG